MVIPEHETNDGEEEEYEEKEEEEDSIKVYRSLSLFVSKC
jgi:hypothetical protein